MEILICSRFAFLSPPGRGGIDEDVAAEVFEADRVQARLLLFELVTLASLAAQSRQEFHHLILTSSRLPEAMLERLERACLAAYGEGRRFTVLARPPEPAKRSLSAFMAERYGTAMVAQVLLHDDDGLAPDYVEDLAPRLDRIAAEVRLEGRELPYFLSYPRGYLLDLRGEVAGLYRSAQDFIDLGLVLVGRPKGCNIFGVRASRAPRKFGAEIVGREGSYLRCLHGYRDDAAELPEAAEPVEGWREDAALLAAMPVLTRIGGPG